MEFNKKWLFYLFLLVILLLQVTCTTKSELRFKKLSKEVKSDNYFSAIKTIKRDTRLYGKTNRLLYNMDIGLLFHYADSYDSSNFYLEKAVGIYDELFTHSVTNETAALLTNDNIRPYRSKPYEMIFIHQIMMLNHLSGGNYDDALVESRRAQLLIDQWEGKEKRDEKYTPDGLFHYMSALSYNQVNEPDNAAISLFKSVRAYQRGVVPLPNHVANLAYHTFLQNEREDDIELLNLRVIVPQDNIAGFDRDQAEIIFIGYAGRGPVLGEKVWWGTWVRDGLMVLHHKSADGSRETITMAAPRIPGRVDSGKTLSGTTFHIKFAMPELKVFPSETGYFTIESSSFNNPVKSFIMNDMDKLCAQYLENTKAKTVLRTVVRVVSRTIAAQRVKKKMATESGAANLLLNIGTDILAGQMEKADTRSLFLMPKTIHLARIPVMPGAHTVEVFCHSHSGTVNESRLFEDLVVAAGEKKFLFYPSLL